MVPPAKPGPLRLRILSALVLGPPVLAAIWAGGVFLDALMLLAVGVMGWEWGRLVGRGRFGLTGLLVIATGEAAVAALIFGAGARLAALLALIGAVAAGAVAALWRGAEPLWAALGALWLSLAALSFLGLAQSPVDGRATVFWLLVVVWTNDVAAYGFGRTLGGPKLAPGWSPNKTWAGFFGGVVCAGLVGLLWSVALHRINTTIGVASALLAAAAQLGDLAESLAKRHFGVKDSSGLIPGHGGLLDRVDGLLAASVVAGVARLVASHNPITW